jgi:hypothetical protein
MTKSRSAPTPTTQLPPRHWSGNEALNWWGMPSAPDGGAGVAFDQVDAIIPRLFDYWNWIKMARTSPIAATCCPGFVVTERQVLLNPALFGTFSELELEGSRNGLELRGDGYPLGPGREFQELGEAALKWWLRVGSRVINDMCDFEENASWNVPWEKPMTHSRRCMECKELAAAGADYCDSCWTIIELDLAFGSRGPRS